jgi:hypothetical protein
MASTIVTKHRTADATAPTVSDIIQGELAINFADEVLYSRDESGNIVQLGVKKGTSSNSLVRWDGTNWVEVTSVTIDGSGNMGVGGTLGVTGATTLSSTLGVTGATTLSNDLTINKTGNGFFSINGTDAAFIRLQDSGGSTNQKYVDFVTDNGSFDIRLLNDDTSVKSIPIAIAPTGGIAVAGTLGVAGVTTISNQFIVDDGDNSLLLEGRTDGGSLAGTGAANISVIDGVYASNPIAGARIAFAHQGSGGQRGGLTFASKNVDDDATQPTVQGVLTPAGNWGFGTTNPGYKVEVAGTLGVAGDVVIGTSGKGIDFSANTGAAGEDNSVLKWAELGNFTPTLLDSGSLNPSEGQTYNQASGRYQRIGNVVTIFIELYMSSLGTLATGEQAVIGGLPFTMRNAARPQPAFVCQGDLLAITAGTSIVGTGNANATHIYLSLWDSTTGVSPLLISEVSADGFFRITGQYEV